MSNLSDRLAGSVPVGMTGRYRIKRGDPITKLGITTISGKNRVYFGDLVDVPGAFAGDYDLEEAEAKSFQAIQRMWESSKRLKVDVLFPDVPRLSEFLKWFDSSQGK